MITLSLPTDLYSIREYAVMLKVTPRTLEVALCDVQADALRPSGTRNVRLFRPVSLPARFQENLSLAQQSGGCMTLRELLFRQSRQWRPDFTFAKLPVATQAKAKKVQSVLQAYFDELDATGSKTKAVLRAQAAWLQELAEPCNEKTIRRWVIKIEERGGIELAPIEAYADQKSVPHVSARLENKLQISGDFIAHFKSRCVKPGMMHIRAAVREMEIDWLSGRSVPGIGLNPAYHDSSRQDPTKFHFPYKPTQLRKFAPPLSVRKAAGQGIASAKRDALPHNQNDYSQLLRAQGYVLDDSRVDIIGTDPYTGKPVELKSYWMLDLATRRIEGFLIREAGNIKASDVDALVARVLRSSGLAPLGSGHKTTITFERGTVACSPARESLLLSHFPDQLRIRRTGMDGGTNFSGDYTQESSGRWMNKAPVESFMRTFAYFVQHIPGQRGGDYRRQPAHLGLVGRDRESGNLKFLPGSQIAEGALLARTNAALAAVEQTPSDPRFATAMPGVDQINGRLRVNALMPVPWIIDRFKEFVAYYNNRTDHRMQGFRTIEELDAKGALKSRMESPNERAGWLEEHHGAPERISPAVVSTLLMKAKVVTVKRNGVLMDITPRKGIRFWKAGSMCCREADLVTTGEKKFLAVYDEESLALNQGPQEIYLCGMPDSDWKPGQPVRFIEHLPLYHKTDYASPGDTARNLKEIKQVEHRMAHELAVAAEPLMQERLDDAKHNTNLLSVVTSSLKLDAPQIGPNQFSQDLADSRRDSNVVTELEQEETRHDQKLSAEQELARELAQYRQQQDSQ